MHKINLKTFIGLLCSSLIILLIMNISVALLQETDHVSKLDRNANHRYLVSTLSDQDLNLNNQVFEFENWVSSTTQNYPDLHSWGGIIAWIPFYAYVIILGLLGLTNFNCIVDQVDFAQALSAIICFVIVFINLTKIQKTIGIKKNTGLLLGIFFISTPGWWYILIEPSGSYLAYMALLSLILFYLLSLKLENLMPYNWFLLGMLSYILVAIKNFGYFLFIGIFVYVLYLKIKKLITSKNYIFYITGSIIVGFLEILNSKIKYGNVVTIFSFLKDNFFEVAYKKLIIYDSMFGTSGIIYRFPIYLLSFYGLASLNYKIFFVKNSVGYKKYLLLALSLALIGNYFLSINYWYPEKNFLGAGIFESQILWALGLVYFFSENRWPTFKIIFVSCSLAWSLVFMMTYYVDRNIYDTQINLDYFKVIFNIISIDIELIINNYKESFKFSFFWFPAIFFILFFIYQANIDDRKWKIFNTKLAVYIGSSFLLISALNIYRHFQPQEQITRLQEKVITTDSLYLFSYKDYMSFLEANYILATKSNKKERLLVLREKINNYNEVILSHFKKAPELLTTDDPMPIGSILKNKAKYAVINHQKKICKSYSD